jgi:hypothetical protein
MHNHNHICQAADNSYRKPKLASAALGELAVLELSASRFEILVEI